MVVIEKDKPTFDFSAFSQNDSKAYARLQLRLERAMRQMNGSAEMDDETFEAKLAEIDTLVAEAEKMLAKMLLTVPRSWLVPDAPNDIDWQADGALGWLRADKMDELRAAVVEARQPSVVSGN